ncbi:hypothetical protein [Lederbergia citrea]|uniref:hypothetical protein n=1 Tax=Lederbergia citrea TaxID=2833581 RepID=UPI001BC9AFDE|nr:hypothetical protein [Lederbergia citrea]MBS4179028.1 hypothetical protein [Lederbergia citrea]
MAIIPLLIIIAIVVLPSILIMQGVNSSNKRIKSKRLIKTILGCYLAILLLSIALYGLLPTKASQVVVVKEKEADQITDHLYTDIFNGKIQKVDLTFIKDKWTLDYKGEKLKIVQTEGFFEGTIVVERKLENDGEIEGTYYASTIVGGIDVTKEIEPVRVRLVGSKLELAGMPETVNLEYAISKKEFIVNQFTGESFVQSDSDAYRDFQVLYLRIPRNLDLIDEQDMPIHYVGH